MWNKLRSLVTGQAPAQQAVKDQAEKVLLPLRENLTISGRISFELLQRVARERKIEAFVNYFGSPVLVGSAVKAGTMAAPAPDAARRIRKRTLLFRPADMLAEGNTEAEPLQRAVYPLVKNSTSESSQTNVFLVGRTPGNDLVMPDFALSERHARIEFLDNKYYLTDLNSTNGTTVNGDSVKRRTLLKDYDIVAFGRYEFTFLYPDSLFWTLKSKEELDQEP